MAGYIGARSVSLSATVANAQDVTATDTTPEVTIINNTHEDSDLGREGKVIFKGQQSGGEESTLAEIEANHSGSADDEKGQLIFRTNDGSDGASPTERLRIDSNGSISTATLGTSNVKLGLNAGKAIVSGGNYNVVLGDEAGTAISTGDRNTAVGFEAGKTHSTNVASTYIGYRAGYLATGESGTFVGDNAGQNSTGNENTFLGQQAGYTITSGAKNTIIGRYDGNSGGLDIRTTSNNIVLSDGDGNARGYYHGGISSPLWIFENGGTNNQWLADFRNTTSSSSPYGLRVFFNQVSPDDNNTQFFVCRDSTTNRFLITNQGDAQNHDNSYGAISDVKLKEQIENASSQWQDIKDLTVRKYKMKTDIADKGDSNDLWRLGVIAQEVETAGMSGLVYETPDKDEDNKDLGTTTKAVKYSILYMKAVKALQEAMTRIETLETKVAALEAE